MKTTKIDAEKYFDFRSEDVKELYENTEVKELEIKWNGMISGTNPSVDRKTIKKLNSDFSAYGGNLEVYLVDSSQLDILKKPLISFYNPKRTIQSILNINEVKNGLKEALKEKPIEIRRVKSGKRVKFNINYVDGPIIKDDFGKYEKGFLILNEGLKKLEITSNVDFDWWWKPIFYLALIGGGIGALWGHYSKVWEEATRGAIEKAEILYGLKGAGIGAAVGALFDAFYIGGSTVKDKLEEPIRRINLANRLKKKYL